MTQDIKPRGGNDIVRQGVRQRGVDDGQVGDERWRCYACLRLRRFWMTLVGLRTLARAKGEGGGEREMFGHH